MQAYSRRILPSIFMQGSAHYMKNKNFQLHKYIEYNMWEKMNKRAKEMACDFQKHLTLVIYSEINNQSHFLQNCTKKDSEYD